MSPYRTPCEPEHDHKPEARCCGCCHAAVGGCFYGVRWKVGWLTVPAGASASRPGGTPAVVYIDGKWVLESDEQRRS